MCPVAAAQPTVNVHNRNIRYTEKMPATINQRLLVAARLGNLSLAKSLLAKGADPRGEHSSALYMAAANGHPDVTKLLLPLSDPTANSSAALRSAAQNGRLEVVRLLLPFSHKKRDRSWALQVAAMNGHLEVTRLLLPKPDAKTHVTVALRMAVDRGHFEIIKLLLPFANPYPLLSRRAFMITTGCDNLLSCMPQSYARKFMIANPDIAMPRTRAALAAEDLHHRIPLATPSTPQRRRA